ncbi:hypothetical protein [Paenibacillus hunanensis]|uniref:Uncharacterized protein n=1 Tax=Paenibacillus hunanensis TaxID=539262 RepID=A0ABU1IZ86_9BACL|nr:hypothetical protein [Paenibacillus hunanensis]MDR6243533.1 hypothetical protein [Paenibacillus hunanensis]GGI98403.1 hypothetical protein GCM10008022_03970 [Paenibacillus hunanensis]
MIAQRIEYEAKLEYIKNSGLPIPAISVAVAFFSISMNKAFEEDANLWVKLIMTLSISITIGYIVGKLLANSQTASVYVTHIKSIEYELNERKSKQEKIDSAYEAALLYKKEIENSIKKNKLSCEEKRKECLKAKYCSKR